MSLTSPSMAIHTAISKSKHILLLCHLFPDGDALGALTAFGQALLYLNKSFTSACDHDMLLRLSYLPLAAPILTDPDLAPRYDLVIALDCGDARRMGSWGRYLDGAVPLINIDHHATNTLFGDINLVDADAVSTTEILFTLFQEMEIPLSTEIASCLLTGLVTDSLCFRTSNVTADTLEIAGILVAAGANLFDIVQTALLANPLSTVNLWRTGLNNMRHQNGFIWTTISRAEREAIGHAGASSEGLASLLANTNQMRMAAVLIEGEGGKIHVSFRCQPPYDVAALAHKLGGGGHVLAAGCRLPGPINVAAERIVTLGVALLEAQELALADPEGGAHG